MMPGVMPLLIDAEGSRMKRIIHRLTTVVLASAFGLACGASLRAQAPGRDVMSLHHGAAPQVDLDREAMLRKELARLRAALARYAAARAKGLRPFELPRSLEDLVRAGYLRELPVDPMTGERDWQTEEMVCVYGRSWGVMNVRSRSTAISSEGSPYSEW